MAPFKSTEEMVNAVCITRNLAYAFWLLGDFSDLCEDIRLGDGPVFF